MKLAIIAVCIFLVGNASAMYQCKDGQGKTSFQDQPCAAEQRTLTSPSNQPPARPHIGSEQHLKEVADALNRQVAEEIKKDPKPRHGRLEAPAPQATARELSQTMPFEQCVDVANRTALQLGLGLLRAPIVVNSRDLFIRRMCTESGSVLVSCSRPDQKMITRTSGFDPRTGCQ